MKCVYSQLLFRAAVTVSAVTLFATACRSIPPRLEEESWTFVSQFRTAPNVDLFVHDFEGAAAATISHSANATYLVSWPTYVITDESRQEIASGIIWMDGDSVRLLPKPPELRRMVAPISTGDGRGGLHLVWGDSPDSLSRKATELWYSHFDGQEWTPREKLSDVDPAPDDSGVVMWDPSVVASPLIRLTSNDLLFVTKTDHVTRDLALFRRSGSSWARTIIPTGIVGPTYTDVLEVAPGVLLLAGISTSAPPGQSDQGSVLSSTSSDGGAIWSPFVLVHRSGEGTRRLKLTQSPEHQQEESMRRPVFLVWHRSTSARDTVLALRSLDGGRSWDPLPAQPLPSRSQGIDAIARCDGSLEVAVSAAPTDTSKLSVLSTFVWSPNTELGRAGWNPVPARLPRINRRPRFVRHGRGSPQLVIGVVRGRGNVMGPNLLRVDSLSPVTGYASRRGAPRRCEMESD